MGESLFQIPESVLAVQSEPTVSVVGPYTLAAAEQELAERAGRARFDRRRQQKSKQKWGRNEMEHTVELEIEAIGAELAVAAVIGRTWTDSDSPDYHGDVGVGVQVRHSRHEHGRLILHHSDRGDHDFFFVTGVYPSFFVHGWIEGDEGKLVATPRELQPGRPALCVEQTQLKSEWKERR